MSSTPHKSSELSRTSSTSPFRRWWRNEPSPRGSPKGRARETAQSHRRSPAYATNTGTVPFSRGRYCPTGGSHDRPTTANPPRTAYDLDRVRQYRGTSGNCVSCQQRHLNDSRIATSGHVAIDAPGIVSDRADPRADGSAGSAGSGSTLQAYRHHEGSRRWEVLGDHQWPASR